MKLLVRWAALALSFWVATALIPGIDVKGGFTTYLWVALLFGLLNATLGSLLKLLTFPAVILTLGLFLVVVNAAMLMLVSRWSEKLEVENFWAAIFAAIIISVITRLVSSVGTKVIKP
ncbi:MAG: phage holin family protein [Candidatus Planktophila sp.]|jgi:putative membrane protein|nr:phage holin family protein [Candidatus Planktophila sp.]